uniref:Acetylglutamate kinase n=1 Tax=Dicranema revolutum TaxID=239144 RepID=A0A4D6WR67_9FLOR|nr:acetylglutamate kinase [Dicranema revolutum]
MRQLGCSLSSVKEMAGKKVVIKYGGSAMTSESLKTKVLNDILFLLSYGIKPILVHGGGPIINKWLQRLNIKPRFQNGIRLTDRSTMEVVEMVLVGKVNKNLVSLLNKDNCFAIGLSGKDGGLIHASPLFNSSENFAGKIEGINPEIMILLLEAGYIPVIASVAAGINSQSYNINADTVAGAIAKSLNAEKLILLTDTLGIMSDTDDPNTLIKNLSSSQALKLKEQNIISGGMIPKVDCCLDALQFGVESAHIIDGRLEHSLILELFTLNRVGSMLTI